MLRGLYIAGTGMLANNTRIDVVSNNLANVNTTAYKKDGVLTESFEDVLIKKRQGLYRKLYSNDGFTSEKTDIGYDITAPKGFLKVKGYKEDNYSHSARIGVDSEGYLSTIYFDGNDHKYPKMGNRIYGQKGFIKVDDKDYSFDEKGNVLVSGNIVDNLVFKPHTKVIGTLGNGVRISRAETSFTQGQLENTNSPYDLAIEGDGFFEIADKDRTLYTRDGSFKVRDNILMTAGGLHVKGLEGDIVLTGKDFQINEYGEVIEGGKIVDKIKISSMNNTFDLEKVGSNFFAFADNKEIDAKEFEGSVRQGFLEKSNADNLVEMIELIELYRNYESNQRVITAYDQTLDKAVNQIGRV